MTHGNAKFTRLTELVESGEVITTDKYLEAARRRRTWTYWKRDFLYHAGRWRKRLVPPLKWMPHRISEKVVILGHSDIATRLNDVTYLKSRGALMVLGVNCEPVPGSAWALPLGLTNYTHESVRHQVLGRQDLLIRADDESFPEGFKGSIFGCFDTRTLVRERERCARALSRYKGAVFEDPDYSLEGRRRYLASLRRHDFVACPEGNGVDTHRLWETLYMGGIPIVTSSPFIDELCRGLPVITIASWEALPPMETLHEMKEGLSRKTFQWQKLLASFWIAHVSALESSVMSNLAASSDTFNTSR